MKLAIGTAQFGVDYGISNADGKTSQQEVLRILDLGKATGINTLDTAAIYGDSEQVLGQIGIEDWSVVSKVPPLPNDEVNGKDWVMEHIRQSLHRLKIDRLEGLLLHNAADLLKSQGRGLVLGLQEAKAEGMVKKVGYSIYSSETLGELVKVMLPDLVQAPLNVLDKRLIESGWLERLVDAGIEVHVRSIFMQGLLLLGSQKRPTVFDRWHDIWVQWDSIVQGNREHALACCLGFVKAQRGITRIIVGVESYAHLEQLLNIWDKVASFDASDLICDDLQLLEPSNWKLS